MLIEVNNSRLYVDIVGSGLVAEGPEMIERPTVFVLPVSYTHLTLPTNREV